MIPLIVIAVLVLAGSIGITSGSFNDPEGSADNVGRVITDWYDLVWGYRKPITINNSGPLLTDNQVKVTVNTQELIGAGKMQSDGDDIRFTQADGYTEIPYWIKSGINTDSTEIWVKVPSIPGGDSTIYIYYGHSGASSASSLTNTFTSGSFQDLFADNSKIDGSASQLVSVSGGEVVLSPESSEVQDQAQTQPGGTYTIYGTSWVAQTYTAAFTGTLSRITLKAYKTGSPPNDLTVELRNVGIDDLPGSTVIATTGRSDITTEADYDFTFATPPTITAGTKYAIVVGTVGGSSSNKYTVSSTPSTSDTYSSGLMAGSVDSGSSWTEVNGKDLYFKTYVDTAWDLDQSQTGANDSNPVYGDSWRAQSYQAGMDGNLWQVALRIAATGNPPNAVTVQVRDAEEVVGEVLDQSQTSYDNGSQVYEGNYEGQTLKAGSSGDLTRVTLRASQIGSVPSDLIVELRDVVEAYQTSMDQSQTSYDGNRQVYGDDWSAQLFQAGASGDLGILTLRTSKAGSPPNDLTVELRDVVESFQDTLDQSQTSYTGDRQIYGNNWRSQIFQAGASGNLGVITLRTSKTGSPPSDLTIQLRDVVEAFQDTLDQSQTS
ncbi:DUF2341 domain-containing protein, partial [Chloroflexota bacterium]